MGSTVTSVSVIGGDAGTSSRTRLALTGDGVPESVFVKMPAETAATRLMGELGRLADTEVRFYKHLSPELSGVPKSYGSAFDPLTGRYAIVLEDLAVDECEFPDTLHPLATDQADLIVELLARLHATFWGRAPGWAYTASADSASLLTGSLLKKSARRIAARTDIPVELDRDELWDRYRQGALYAYVAPLITAGMGGMQATGIALEGVQRGVAALEDLDTVSVLEKSL